MPIASCSTSPSPELDFPPSASDLELLGQTQLCDKKDLILKQWQGTVYQQISWGSGKQLQRFAQSSQPDHDRFYFFNEDNILVGAVFRYISGIKLKFYPVLQQTLSELPRSATFFLDPKQLLQNKDAKSVTLYRTGDKTSTTQYLLLDDDTPRVIVASIVIDPYEQLLSSYQKKYLSDPIDSRNSRNSKNKNSNYSNKFLALQQFARGEAALFASCNKRNSKMAIAAYKMAIDYGLEDQVMLAESHHRLGLAFSDKKQFKEAQRHFKKSLSIRPNVPEVIHNLGHALIEQGKQNRAMKLFQQAIALRPNYARARFSFAKLLEKTNMKRAIEEYETYLALVEGLAEERTRSEWVKGRIKKLQGK